MTIPTSHLVIRSIELDGVQYIKLYSMLVLIIEKCKSQVLYNKGYYSLIYSL